MTLRTAMLLSLGLSAAATTGCGSSHGPGGRTDGGADEDGAIGDGSAGACARHADCGSGMRCTWEPGCGMAGRCVPDGCTADVVEYTMCDGSCATGSSSCPPGPFLHAGCETDGGVGECGGFLGTPCAPYEWCDYPDGSYCGGDDSTGVCRTRPTACDFIYDPVCGCDGITHDNECAANAAGVDASSPGACATSFACTNDMPCTGGAICIGSGCAGPWSCVLSGRLCTDDSAPYCGCDGVTFYDSSTCPTQPFEYQGACGTVVNCDLRDAFCPTLPPTCPPGQVPSVSGGCFGACVPIGTCACTAADECPMPGTYTCHMSAGRCGPYV